MNLKEQLQEDAKLALKENNNLKKNLLRVLLSELERKTKNPTNQEIYSNIKKMIENAKLINSEESLKEIEILTYYMPPALTEEELSKIVTDVLEKSLEKNVGKLVGLCLRKCDGRSDAKAITKIINEKLK